ncbi:MAG TPA: SDR family oxidoreductase, partial [Acidimicrobiia bacterium]|nr:SDR family oxidoreductase [Acidimicrobiia bacterium]
IGRASAVELTKRGHAVVATARRPETIEELDVDTRLTLDVVDDESVRAAVAAAGDLDVLVNNAGYGIVGPVERLPLDEVRRMFETNVFGAWRMIQAVVSGMRARGSGVVVNVSSLAGRVSSPLNGGYSGSKYALEAMSEALHYEVGHFGIRVVLVEPGRFATRFGETELRLGLDAPYDELDRQWNAAQAKLPTGGDEGAEPPGPEAVAVAIADAVEHDATPLRRPVGVDAEMVVATRASMDDATFEATMREVLGLDW